MEKLSEKREKFVLHFHQYGNATHAYWHAYPKSKEWKNQDAVASKASELLKDGKVMVRLEELKSEVVKEVQYGVKEAYQELHGIYQKALHEGDTKTALSAINSKINLLRLDEKETDDGNITIIVNKR